MATGDLCAVADVQAFLSLNAGQDDALLQMLVTNASAFLSNYLNRNLLTASYVEARNGVGGDRMPFWEYPVTAVASLTIDGVAVPVSTGPNVYGYVYDDKMLYLRHGRFCRGVQNVVISYTAGSPTVPPEVAQACIEVVSVKYKRRLTLDVSAKTLNGETISFTQADMPAASKLALDNYKRVFMI
jgi:hypothetical protein